MNADTKERIKLASLLSVLLCIALTIGYVAGGGDFKGPSIVAYFVMLVICIAMAVSIALEDSD